MIYTITIKGSVYPEPAIGLKGVIDPAEMIRLLDQRYTSTGWNLKYKYLTEYNTLRVEYYDSIGIFVDQYKALKLKLDIIGLPLLEEVYTINFIVLLDIQYSIQIDQQRSNIYKISLILLDLIANILNKSQKAKKAITILYSRKLAANKGYKGYKGYKGSNKKVIKYSYYKK